MSPRSPCTSDLVIIVTADEQMQAVPIGDRVVVDDIDANPIDTITARSNVVFWFNTAAQSAVNKMATLNPYCRHRAVSTCSAAIARNGAHHRNQSPGDPIGLSHQQLALLQAGPAPGRWTRFIL
jgi:hypothetical protein